MVPELAPDTLPWELLQQAPIAVMLAATLIYLTKISRDERRELAKSHAKERGEMIATLRSVSDQVTKSNERVEIAMTKLIDAKSVEAVAITRLTDRIEARIEERKL